MANDNKVTIILRGGMGNIVVKHGRLIEHGRRPYAQYRSAPFVLFVEKGKRKETGTIQGYKPYIVILEGWQDIKSQDFLGKKDTISVPGLEISRSTYAAFDDRWVSDFENSVELKNIIADYRNVNTYDVI